MEHWISQGLVKAQQEGISGPSVTPFLLQNLFAMSHKANIALLKENARLAANKAVALSKISKE